MSRSVRIRAALAASALAASVLGAVATAPPAAADPDPGVSGTVTSVEPARVLDTRSGIGAPVSAVAARGAVTVQVAGRGGIPATGVASVFLTVTVTQPRASGYLSVRPTGGGSTGTSTLNFSAGQTLANSTLVALGSGGQVTVENNAAGSSQVVLDVTGYTAAGPATQPGAVVGLRPARLLDTRSGTGGPKAALAPGASVVVDTVGRGGLPLAGVGALLLNVTATATTNSGYLTVGSAGTVPGRVSNLNWTRTGQTVANQVQTEVDADGRFLIVNRGSRPVAVIADVQGYVVAGRPTVTGALATFPAERAADTRSCCDGAVGADGERFALGAVNALPPVTAPNGYSIAAVVATVTVTRTTATGYVTVWSGDGSRPLASNANWAGAGQTVATQVLIPVTDVLHQFVGVAVVGGRADVVIDVSGYVLLDPSAAPPPVEVTSTNFQQNAFHDGHAAGSVPSTATQRWDVDFGADQGMVGYPLVVDGSVYAVTNRIGGEQPGQEPYSASLWQLDLDGNIVGGPVELGGSYHRNSLAWDSGLLFVADDDGGLTAFGPGLAEVWGRVNVASGEDPAVVATGGRVYVATGAEAQVFDGGTGNLLWATPLPDLSSPGIAVDASGVYLSGGAERTVKLDLSGRPVWESGTSAGGGTGTVALHHGRLWVRVANSNGGAVLDAATGVTVRRFDGDRPVAFAQDTSLTQENGALSALDERDGSVIWQQGVGVNDLSATPLTTDDSVYTGGVDGTVRGYSLITGALTWTGHTPTTPSGSLGAETGMAIGGGLLLVPNGTHLTAFGAPVA